MSLTMMYNLAPRDRYSILGAAKDVSEPGASGNSPHPGISGHNPHHVTDYRQLERIETDVCLFLITQE
jgi:hypothetical protein